jgi:hypothetical protein
MKGLKYLRKLFDKLKTKNLLKNECEHLIMDCEQAIDSTPFDFTPFANLTEYLLESKKKDRNTLMPSQKATSPTCSSSQSAANQSIEAQISEKDDYSDFSEREKRILVKIQKQDKRLMQLNKVIIELESREIDLNDLDSEETPYLIEDRLKSKFMKLYKKFTLYCKKNAHLIEKLPKLHMVKRNIKFDGTFNAISFII